MASLWPSFPDKPLVWLSTEVKTPPLTRVARLEAGLLLRRLQRGELLQMPHSRPMPGIGRRYHELRLPDKTSTWRIVYRIDADAIVIAAVFAKKTRVTPREILDMCQRRSHTYDNA